MDFGRLVMSVDGEGGSSIPTNNPEGLTGEGWSIGIGKKSKAGDGNASAPLLLDASFELVGDGDTNKEALDGD